MSAEPLPPPLARLIGEHPAALRAVRWVSRGSADTSASYLEIETKHGLVVIIDPVTGVVSANPPQPAQASAGSVRRQQDLTEQVPVAFDDRPRFTAVLRTADHGYRFELSTGAAFTLRPDNVVPSWEAGTPMIRIELADRSDHPAILALNDTAIPAVNRIDAAALADLHDQARWLLVARAEDHLVGFLLVLDEQADYGSPNYGYFRTHYDRFAYVDRIVVSDRERGLGVGSRLYAALFAQAGDVPRITCEVNVRPPNPASLRFHERLGFQVVGEQDTEGGAKRVALMVRTPAP